MGTTDSGVYIAVFHLSKLRRIRVGRLGQIRFQPGYYLYVGSAQKNLSARLERHGKKRKPARWHIDYLSNKAEMLGAVDLPGPRRRECELAGELSEMFELVAPGFGASDCRCDGHLFYAEQLPT